MSRDFNGTWTIDLDSSTVWDVKQKKQVPDKVGYEVIKINVVDDVQEYEVQYGDGPTFCMGFTCRYDDPTWVAYEVRSVSNVPEIGLDEGTKALKERIHSASGDGYRQLEVGKNYGLVRLVYGDRRTHYRIAKDPITGLVMYVMPRRLAEDGKSYVATILNNDGTVFRVRRFIRVD